MLGAFGKESKLFLGCYSSGRFPPLRPITPLLAVKRRREMNVLTELRGWVLSFCKDSGRQKRPTNMTWAFTWWNWSLVMEGITTSEREFQGWGVEGIGRCRAIINSALLPLLTAVEGCAIFESNRYTI